MPALREPDEDVLAREIERAVHPLSKPVDLVLPLRQQLQNIMWDDVGVVRSGIGMQRGLQGIESVSDALMSVGVDGRIPVVLIFVMISQIRDSWRIVNLRLLGWKTRRWRSTQMTMGWSM